MLPLLTSFIIVLAQTQTAEPTSTPKTRTVEKREVRSEIQERREELKEEFEKRREEAKTERETRREELKQKLETIKDERKQKITENIDERLSSANTKWTNHWNDVLKRLSEVIVKLESRTQKAKDNGKNTASVTEKIETAKKDINLAQEAVNIQAAKTYTIDATSEEKLGEEVKATIEQFHSDIKGVREKIDTARKSVAKAIAELGKVIESQRPTGSPIPTTN